MSTATQPKRPHPTAAPAAAKRARTEDDGDGDDDEATDDGHENTDDNNEDEGDGEGEGESESEGEAANDHDIDDYWGGAHDAPVQTFQAATDVRDVVSFDAPVEQMFSSHPLQMPLLRALTILAPEHRPAAVTMHWAGVISTPEMWRGTWRRDWNAAGTRPLPPCNENGRRRYLETCRELHKWSRGNLVRDTKINGTLGDVVTGVALGAREIGSGAPPSFAVTHDRRAVAFGSVVNVMGDARNPILRGNTLFFNALTRTMVGVHMWRDGSETQKKTGAGVAVPLVALDGSRVRIDVSADGTRLAVPSTPTFNDGVIRIYDVERPTVATWQHTRGAVMLKRCVFGRTLVWSASSGAAEGYDVREKPGPAALVLGAQADTVVRSADIDVDLSSGMGMDGEAIVFMAQVGNAVRLSCYDVRGVALRSALAVPRSCLETNRLAVSGDTVCITSPTSLYVLSLNRRYKRAVYVPQKAEDRPYNAVLTSFGHTSGQFAVRDCTIAHADLRSLSVYTCM